MLQPLWETIWQFLKMVNMELSCDSAIPLLGIYPREINTCGHTQTFPWVSMATGFLVVKKEKWTNPNVHQLIHEYTKAGCPYNRILFNNNKVKCWYTPQHGWSWKTLWWLKEAGLQENHISYDFTFMWNIQNRQIYKERKWFPRTGRVERKWDTAANGYGVSFLG